MPTPDNRGAVPGVATIAAAVSVPHLDRAQFEVDLGNPKHIHQHALDLTGEAYRLDDFDLFAAFFHLPHEIDTFALQKTIRTRTDLEDIYRFARAQLEEDVALTRIRDCISAEFADATTLVCVHVTRIMRGTFQLRDAIPCQSVFRAIDGVWLLTRSSYAIEETDAPFDRLLTRRPE